MQPPHNTGRFSNSSLAPLRKRVIKRYFMWNRVAQKLGISVDDLFNMYLDNMAVGATNFCELMITNRQNFRDIMFGRYFENKDE